MSDISSDDLFLRQKRHRRCSSAAKMLSVGTRGVYQDKAKDTVTKDKGSVRKVVDLTLEQEHARIVVQEGDRRYEMEACMDDQFQKVFRIEASDTSTRIEYKNTIVSKYVTLRELGFHDSTDVFFLIRSKEEKRRSVYQVKINFDIGEDFVVEIAEDCKIKDLLKLCSEASPLKRRHLVMNGVLLSEDTTVCDVLDDGDTLDYVVK